MIVTGRHRVLHDGGVTLSPYRVTGALFDRIAAGGGGAEAVGVLAGSEHSRRLVLLRAVVARAEEWGGAPGAEARRARSVLSAARRTAPAVVRELLCRPSTGLGLLHCLRAFDAGGDAPSGPAGYPQSGSPYPYPCPSPEPLTALSAAAVVRTGLARTVALPVRDEGVLLPATGLARFPVPGTVTRPWCTADRSPRWRWPDGVRASPPGPGWTARTGSRCAVSRSWATGSPCCWTTSIRTPSRPGSAPRA